MESLERTPDAVVRRLPGYYRHLRELEAEGITRISSGKLAERMGLTASQIRQDISAFGGFGQQGYGYNVPRLRRHFGEIMGIDREHRIVIVGAGNLGRAIANYANFKREGFRLVALFDVNPAMIGQDICSVPVLSVEMLPTYLACHPVDIVAITTPADQAQRIADIVSGAKIRGIWNFAPVDLQVSGQIELSNVHLSDSLLSLSFRLHEQKELSGGRALWHFDKEEEL